VARTPIFQLSLLAAALAGPSALMAQAAAPDIPRTQFIATMDGEFKKVDADKDGQLTRVEIEQFQKATVLAQAQARSRALFTALDTDKNGQISATEFTRLPVNPPQVDASRLLGFDTNKDGKVSLIEHRAATLGNFDRLDTDKDGIVSVAEMKAGGIIK